MNLDIQNVIDNLLIKIRRLVNLINRYITFTHMYIQYTSRQISESQF